MQMKTIYLLFTQSNTLISRLIKFTTKAEYTHASISLSKNIFPFYSFGRKYNHLPLPAGFKKEHLDKGFLFKNPNIPCAIFSIDTSDEQYETMREYIEKTFESDKKYKFNMLGLITCKFGKPLKRKQKMFCSEFVANTLNRGNITNFSQPALVHPITLSKIPEAQCIYKGRIKDIPRIMKTIN